MANKTVERVYEIIKPFSEELKLDIWDVKFVKEGSNWYLRIFIDKEGGVDINDCVDLTHAITKPLDEADPISQSYTLEVSSPGVERELTQKEHFEKYINSPVFFRLIRPIENVRDFKGILKSYDNGDITVEVDGADMKFNKKEASFIKLDDFDIKDFDKEID